jgi:RHS repeat-associated protein
MGVRSYASGAVEVYKNGSLVGTRDVSSWPYYDDGGYIGLRTVGGPSTYYDDFGGGSLPVAYQPGNGKVLAVFLPPQPVMKLAPSAERGQRPRLARVHPSSMLLTRPAGVIWRSYYYAGPTRIAMREDSDEGSAVYYLLTDHLGSTSVAFTFDEYDQVDFISRQRYTPWGETRTGSSVTATDYGFTGQRTASFGLLFYQSRWYDPVLSRFAQADTVVPVSGNPLAWDRYAGMFNNPAKFSDPNGHLPKDSNEHMPCTDDYCGTYQSPYLSSSKINSEKYWKDMVEAKFGVTIVEGNKEWGTGNILTIYYGLSMMISRLGIAFTTFNGVTVSLGEHISDGISRFNGEVTNGTNPHFYTTSDENFPLHHFFHEFGHVIDNLYGEAFETALGTSAYYVDETYVFGGEDVGYINTGAFNSGVVNGAKALQHPSDKPNEQWADIFANYMSNNINNRPMGRIMYDWVNNMFLPFP